MSQKMITEGEFVNLITQKKYPSDNPSGKCFIAITTPSCQKCKTLFNEENWAKIGAKLGDAKLYLFSYTGDKKAAEHLSAMGLLSVPAGLCCDLEKDKLSKSSELTKIEDVLAFISCLND